jgi:uncharacterized membrane protein YgcG
MQAKTLKLLWLGSLGTLAFASYTWPGFGVVFVCASVVLLAIANNLLSIQSKELGLFTGSSAAALALATSAGAGLSALQLLLFAAIGAIAGYVFAAMPVGSERSSESSSNDDDGPSKVKAGGGDFGGGGASGKF